MDPRKRSPDPLDGALRFPHRALVLTGLSGLAFAQPLLGDMSVDFFVAHRSRPVDLVVLALVVLLVPPAILLAFEGVVARVQRRMLLPIHVLIVGALFALATTQLLVSRLGWAPRTLIGVLAGAVAAAAYWRLTPVRSFAAALVIAPALAFASFLFLGSTAVVVFPPEASSVPARSTVSSALAPVVLLAFDELPGTTLVGPDGRVDRRLFPNFARVARQSTWYPNATTVHCCTEHAVPAIFTGRISSRASHATEAGHPNSLFTLLASRYEMNVSEPYTHVCPRAVCEDPAPRTAPRRVAGLLKNVGRLSADRYLPGVLSTRVPPVEQSREIDPQMQLERFQRALRPGPRPGLHVLHVLLPHEPWRYLPNGQRYQAPPSSQIGVQDERLVGERWPVVQRYQRHVLQTQYADRLLGQLVDRMEDNGLWDDSVVVLVADHGLAIRPGAQPRWKPDRANYQDVMSVPLLVKEPGQRSAHVSRRFAQTVDVVPTIADVLGLRVPWRAHGKSALSRGHRRRELRIYGESGGPLTVDAAAFRARASVVVSPRSELLAAEERGGDAFSIGPFPELLQRELPSALPEAPGVVRLDGPGTLPAAGARAREVPARLAGKAEGMAAGRPLAVAVGRRIVATTLTYRSGRGGVSVTAMLPPGVFERGGRVSLLAISHERGRLGLAGIRVEGGADG